MRPPRLCLYYSTTSPYARIARVALAEKGFADIDGALTDPWTDAPGLLAANPSARVPAMVLDGGLPLTESLLIVLWLETQHPAPSLLGPAPGVAISKAGIAMGAIDAAASIIIGRRLDPAVDESPLGLRRRRSIVEALERLESDPPLLAEETADLAVIAAVVLVDYIRFRFAEAIWVPAIPALDALAASAGTRASFASTRPRDMPRA
ncbi:glutathione S-transferase family protein [Variovorax sp. RHLX14]|uniref:glutathione S-transferase family protein n=1 Tax=Variovorax sp. RHLX14 TaxID=1259731 RepID=UPI003F49A62E